MEVTQRERLAAELGVAESDLEVRRRSAPPENSQAVATRLLGPLLGRRRKEQFEKEGGKIYICACVQRTQRSEVMGVCFLVAGLLEVLLLFGFCVH